MMVDKKLVVFSIIGIIALVIGVIYIRGSESSSLESSGGVFNVKLSSDQMGNYEPNKIKVKAGTKVRIEGDLETLSGGMDTVIIEGYGVNKKITPGDNVIDFVANKKGEFRMYCANGMGNGKLIVS